MTAVLTHKKKKKNIDNILFFSYM